MKRILNIAAILTFTTMAISLSSCIKEKPNVIPEPKPPVTQPTTGKMEVRFNYVFGANQVPWTLGNTYVHAKTGDTLTFTNFRFYVSNIKLKKNDGTWWIHPKSYFLVDSKTAAQSTLSINDIPNGSYSEMQYTMGVDSLMNVSGAHDGALSFDNGMFWDWNTGYIMLKAEGDSPNSPTGKFALHLGGFSGVNNIVTVKSTDFSGQTLNINRTKTQVVKLSANPARLWHSSPGVDSVYVIHSISAVSSAMAKDFYSAISFMGIE